MLIFWVRPGTIRILRNTDALKIENKTDYKMIYFHFCFTKVSLFLFTEVLQRIIYSQQIGRTITLNVVI